MNADYIREFNDTALYTDRAAIYRYKKTKHRDGSTTQSLKIIPKLKDIPCLLSIERSDEAVSNEEANEIRMIYTLLLSDLIELKAGDHIRVTRKGKTYRFIAGLGIKYDFHQEIPLSFKEWA